MRLAGKRPRRATPEPEVDQQPADVGPLPEPAKSATHPEWVAYAVSKGADRADAQLADKEDLIVAFGTGKPR